MKPTVLAIDPGFVNTGWAVLDPDTEQIVAVGCITTQPSKEKRTILRSDDDSRRCQEIVRKLHDAVQLYGCRALVVENPTGGSKSQRAAASMAMARAMTATMAALLDLPTEWVPPNRVKRLAGKQNASKVEVQGAVIEYFKTVFVDVPFTGIASKDEHIGDALGAFIVARKEGQLVRAMAGLQPV